MRRRNMSLTAVLTVVVMLFVLPILLSGCGGGGGGTGTPNGGPVYNPTLTESSGDTLTGINSPTPTTSPSPPVGSLQLALERQATRSVAPEDKIPPETKFLRCTLTGTANYGPVTVAYENPATLSGVPAGTFTLKVEFLVNETDTTAIGSFTTTATITNGGTTVVNSTSWTPTVPPTFPSQRLPRLEVNGQSQQIMLLHDVESLISSTTWNDTDISFTGGGRGTPVIANLPWDIVPGGNKVRMYSGASFAEVTIGTYNPTPPTPSGTPTNLSAAALYAVHYYHPASAAWSDRSQDQIVLARTNFVDRYDVNMNLIVSTQVIGAMDGDFDSNGNFLVAVTGLNPYVVSVAPDGTIGTVMLIAVPSGTVIYDPDDNTWWTLGGPSAIEHNMTGGTTGRTADAPQDVSRVVGVGAYDRNSRSLVMGSDDGILITANLNFGATVRVDRLGDYQSAANTIADVSLRPGSNVVYVTHAVSGGTIDLVRLASQNNNPAGSLVSSFICPGPTDLPGSCRWLFNGTLCVAKNGDGAYVYNSP